MSDQPPNVEGRDDRSDDVTEVDLPAWCRLLAAALAAEGVAARAEASLSLVDPSRIADLNVEHLGGSGPTDVLSVPIDGTGPVADDEPWLVGDVVLCPEVAAAQAPTHAGTVDDELALLVVHGALHLCGWDHATPDEQVAMQRRERELLTALHGVPGRDPWEAA